MFEYDLYLALPLTRSLLKHIQENPQRSVYISSQEEGLEEVVVDGVSYLGKRCGDLIDVSGLELLKSNIHSILRKLCPEDLFIEEPLYLLTLARNNGS